MERVVPFIPWLLGAAALFSALAAFRAHRRQKLIEGLPTSRALGVFIGLVELKGVAASEKPLRSHLAGVPCVHFRWKIEEEWRRTETVTETDSDGKPRTTTRTSSGWTTLAEGGETQSFYLKDATGSILIHPQGAELDAQTVFNRTCSTDDALYFDKGPASEIADSTHRRRFTEHAFRLHGPVYVVGKARERRDIAAAEVAQSDTAEMFLISSRTEDQVRSSLGLARTLWFVAGLALLVGAVVVADVVNLRDTAARRPVYLGAAGAYVLLWWLGWAWNIFNDLVGLRNRVREAWSLVDVQLKRRHDLIPNLVRIVTALKEHDRLVQEEIAALRAQLEATPPGKPGPDYHALARPVAAVQEKYPALSAMPAYQNLQRHLVDTEQRIGLARDYFNSIATHFNTRIEQFPERIVAMLTVMRRFPLLAAQDFERAAVNVQFAK